jgi:hypothetical protein
VPVEGTAKDKQLNDTGGKHGEAGIAYHLQPNNSKNIRQYEELTTKYKELGGDDREADQLNKNAADAIKKSLPPGSGVLGCQRVGNLGSKKLSRMGIDPKTDPTDIIVFYTEDGKEKIKKFSIKTYRDPKNINMKNAGVGSAGINYLGASVGQVVDARWLEIKKELSWDDSMPPQEIRERKSKMKREYLKSFGGQMEELAKTEEGQSQLLDMWKNVHGCGKYVNTLIINRNTQQIDIKDTNHYCNPNLPFRVHYDGAKILVEMETGGPQFLQIDLKTEHKKSPIVIFKHRIK